MENCGMPARAFRDRTAPDFAFAKAVSAFTTEVANFVVANALPALFRSQRT